MFSPTLVKVPGSVTEVRAAHSAKAPSPTTQVLGSAMEVRRVHWLNPQAPIDVNEFGIVREINALHSQNAPSVTLFNFSGSVSEISPEQLPKALHPMLTKLSGISIEVI